jgi:hypothetical protein
VREYRQELVLAPVGLLERELGSQPVPVLDLESLVGARQLGVGLQQMAVEHLELACTLGLQCRVGDLELRIGLGEALVQLLQFLTLRVQLHEHGHLAAQDLGHDRD